MSNGAVGNWSENAKKSSGAKADKCVPKSKGNIIMEIAEILRPWLTKMLDGVRDNKGMLVQQATIRAMALNVAQGLVNKCEEK